MAQRFFDVFFDITLNLRTSTKLGQLVDEETSNDFRQILKWLVG